MNVKFSVYDKIKVSYLNDIALDRALFSLRSL